MCSLSFQDILNSRCSNQATKDLTLSNSKAATDNSHQQGQDIPRVATLPSHNQATPNNLGIPHNNLDTLHNSLGTHNNQGIPHNNLGIHQVKGVIPHRQDKQDSKGPTHKDNSPNNKDRVNLNSNNPAPANLATLPLPPLLSLLTPKLLMLTRLVLHVDCFKISNSPSDANSTVNPY